MKKFMAVAILPRNQWYSLDFPLLKYLNQPLFASDTTINPCRFWRNYQLQHLQACWENDSRQLLETCWQLNCLLSADFILYMLIETSLQPNFDNSWESN